MVHILSYFNMALNSIGLDFSLLRCTDNSQLRPRGRWYYYILQYNALLYHDTLSRQYLLKIYILYYRRSVSWFSDMFSTFFDRNVSIWSLPVYGN